MDNEKDLNLNEEEIELLSGGSLASFPKQIEAIRSLCGRFPELTIREAKELADEYLVKIGKKIRVDEPCQFCHGKGFTARYV